MKLLDAQGGNQLNKYVGKRLNGRYEVKELIGFGGMADVYLALDVVDQKNVAVKILKEEYITNDDFKRRFRNESKAIAVLSHPNIVKVFDVNFGDRVQFIVMEHIDGITLKEYLQQQKIVNWKETVHFAVQILRALQHAHDNGIIHRDIKPQNVMLLQDGTVKVMDFGIARFTSDHSRTISDKAIGSVHYISPEQVRGEDIDEKADIYSIGIMMFELLTGKLPFDGETPVAIAVKQMQEQPPQPRSINPDIPMGLEEIVIRSIKKDPELRYQTSAEMLRDIDEFKRNPSVVFEYRYFTDEKSQYFDPEKTDPEEDIVLRKRMSPVMQILLGVTLAALVMVGAALWMFFRVISNPKKDIVVDDFVGLVYEEVISDETYQEKFKFSLKRSQMSDEFEAGLIIAQTPDAGTVVKEGQKIALTVSMGLNIQTVPDVAGKTEEEAVKILTDAGFSTVISSKYSEEVEEGLVIGTNPASGEVAKKSQNLQIYVSLGSKSATDIEVPSLVGLTQTLATEMLESLELVPLVQQVDSIEPRGRVLSQSIAAGEKVPKNTSITITVSTGKSPKTDLTITISFSNAADQDFTFVTYMDNVQVDQQTINPARGPLNVPLSGSGDVNVVVMIGGDTYATYRVNFDSQTVTPASNPNHGLIAPRQEPGPTPEPQLTP